MKAENFVIELQKNYPNGRFVHIIAETGYTIMNHVKKYLNTKSRVSLFIAYEYLKTLNKKIGSKYSLRDISELKGCDIIDEIESQNRNNQHLTANH